MMAAFISQLALFLITQNFEKLTVYFKIWMLMTNADNPRKSV